MYKEDTLFWRAADALEAALSERDALRLTVEVEQAKIAFLDKVIARLEARVTALEKDLETAHAGEAFEALSPQARGGEAVRLVDRVKGLVGPDREVDCLIWAHFDGRTVREEDNAILARNNRPPHDECLLGRIDPGKHQRNFTEAWARPPVPNYTGSIDAAVALIERVMPKWRWTLYGPNGKNSTVCFSPPVLSKEDDIWSTAPPPALALLIALLSSHHPSKGGET